MTAVSSQPLQKKRLTVIVVYTVHAFPTAKRAQDQQPVEYILSLPLQPREEDL